MKDKTLSTVSFVILIFYFITKNLIFFYIGFGLLLIYNFIPFLDRFISGIWLGFSKILGKINSKVILSIIWFFILTPLALLRRIGSNPLQLNKSEMGSYWVDIEKKFTKKDIERNW